MSGELGRVCRDAFVGGGEIRTRPEAGLDDMYVCEMRAPAERENIIGGNGPGEADAKRSCARSSVGKS